MVSIDLSILAASPDAYDVYSKAVREEYAHVPDLAFRRGRTVVLRKFLAAPILFPHPPLAAIWDAPARVNLTREVTRLEI